MTQALFVAVLCVLHSLSSIAMSQDAGLPAELVKLRSLYESELSRVTEPIRKKYLAGLVKLQEHYTKSGDLEKALAVRDEIQKEGGGPANENSGPVTTRDFVGTEWQWGTGGTLKLERGGDAIHSAWSTPGAWKRVNNVTLSLQRPGGDPPMTIVFSDEKLTDAVVTSHLGTSTTLKRIEK